MTTAHRIVLGNNQTHVFASPPPWGPLGYPQIIFTATDPSHPGGVSLGAPLSFTAPHPPLQTWRFQSITADGTPGHEVFGSMGFAGIYEGTASINGMHLSYGNVTLSTAQGGAYTLNGNMTITNESTLTTFGGRYNFMGPNFGDKYTLNGHMSVTNQSVANFDGAQLVGTGSINVGSGSIVDAKTINAGLHMNVDRGGTLSLLYPNSSGMINLARGGAVYVAGAATATKEIFHEASGTLDLLNSHNARVAELKFAPGSHEYTSAASFHGGLLEITTNPMMAGNLHTTFLS